MELRREIQLAVAVFLGVLMLLSLGSVLLFQRMTPAIERILEENVYSLESVEDMLALLSTEAGGAGRESERLERFEAALHRVASNVTEARERPVIGALTANYRAALAGDPEARSAVVASLRRLAAVNRSAAVRADEDAKRLGTAGAWAVVFIGLLGLGWGALVTLRLRRRVIDPIVEVSNVLHAHEQGEQLRRCKPVEGAVEIETIGREVNRLLDERMRPRAEIEKEGRVRSVLVDMLEERRGAAFIVDRDGRITAANRAGLDRLAQSDGLRDQLRAVSAGGECPSGMEARSVAGGAATLLELRPAPDSAVEG